MSTVRETIQAKIDNAKAYIAKLEGEIAAADALPGGVTNFLEHEFEEARSVFLKIAHHFRPVLPLIPVVNPPVVTDTPADSTAAVAPAVAAA